MIVLGFFLVFIVGSMWFLIGVVLSRVATLNVPEIAFFALGNVITAFFAWLVIADWSILLHKTPVNLFGLIFWMALAGVFNTFGQLLLVFAMRKGHKGISWGITQAAMLIPFLLSIIIWKEAVTGILGIVFMIMAILIMSLGKNSIDASSQKSRFSISWLLAALGSFFLSGFVNLVK